MATTALLVLDLMRTFAFALNGALIALRATHLDIVGVVALGMITALGGGTIRDVLLDALPPATFVDWRYLAVAAGGGLIAFFSGRHLEPLPGPINALDATGLSVFAVTGALKRRDLGFGPTQAILVGAIKGVGGGTIRDVLIRRVPSVLSSGLYAIPALIGATAVVLPRLAGASGPIVTIGAAVLGVALSEGRTRWPSTDPAVGEPAGGRPEMMLACSPASTGTAMNG